MQDLNLTQKSGNPGQLILHCKIRITSFPSPAGMSLIKLFLARESLVSDIPPGDGKQDNLFYSVVISRRKEQKRRAMIWAGCYFDFVSFTKCTCSEESW